MVQAKLPIRRRLFYAFHSVKLEGGLVMTNFVPVKANWSPRTDPKRLGQYR
jgi:hypothetical protein